MLGVALFWIGTSLAGAAEEGYRPTGQYLSELAARDSGVAPLAIGAFLASAVAHAAGAAALWAARGTAGRTPTRSRLAGAALAAAAVAVAAIAGFRLSGGGPGDVLDTLHAAAVVAYQLAWVLAVLAWGPARVAVPVAAVSSALLVASLGEGAGVPGLLQRLWVVVDQAWLLVAATRATGALRPARQRSAGPPR